MSRRNPRTKKTYKVVGSNVLQSSTPVILQTEEVKIDPSSVREDKNELMPHVVVQEIPEEKHPEEVIVKPVGVKSKPNKEMNSAEYKLRYPVLKKHKNTHFPQVTYHLPVSMSFDSRVIEAVSLYHPCKLEEQKVQWRDNEHPFCASMRSITEAWALRNLIDECEVDSTPDLMIMDVGGAARRHFSLSRNYVWSCIPSFDARDMVRSFKLPGSNHCSHVWQDCDCIAGRTLASMSVHSLYYIPPSDILKLLLTQVRPVHYAVLHEYPMDKGSLMQDEMEYVKHQGKIWVKARGNLTYYNHSDMDWLKSGHYSDENGTLEWDYARRFGDTVVMRFVASSVIYPPPPSPPSDLVFTSKSEDVNVVPKESSPPGTSDGPRSEKVSDPDDISVYEEIVNSSMDYGSAITQKSYALYLSKIKRKGNAKGCNAEKLGAYASEKYATQSTVIAEVPKRLHDVATERMRRLQLQVMEYHYLRLLVTLFCWFSLLMFRFFGVKYFEVLLRLFSTVDLMSETFTWILLTLISCYVAYNFDHIALQYKCKRYILPSHQANIFWTVKAMVYDYCCKLPDRETDPSKLLKISYPPDFELECDMKPAALAMVYHPLFPPYFPRKCLHNSVSCIKNKLLHKLPGGKYSFGLHKILEAIAFQINGNLDPLNFESWVSRFPGPKQKKLRREFENNMTEHLGKNFNESTSFCKFEAYSEPKYPRPVVAAGVEFNYSTGRWIIGLAEMLSEMLPDNIMLPLHGDAFAIGAFHDTFKHLHKYDTDFTAFDSSQRDEVLLMLARFLTLCGVPKQVVDRELLDTKLIKISNRNGFKVLFKSVRGSGRSMTLLGNCIITINTALHLYGDNLGALLVKGDDSVLYLKNLIPDVQQMTQKYLDNGLIVKMRAVDDYELEFCSSLFVPFSEGTVLVPKFGKLLAKTFWCKNLEYGKEDIERQFASILKGLQLSLSSVPWISSLYENPIYQRWFDKVDAHYDVYNEYCHQVLTPCLDTYGFIANRYKLSACELDELASELKGSFPVRLSSFASEVMIEKDWGPPNDGEHLKEHYAHPKVMSLVFILSPIFEEWIRHFFPVASTVIIGLIESFYYGDFRHFMFHAIYAWIQYLFGFPVALTLHLLVNMAGPKTNLLLLLIMATKKKNGANAPVQTKKRNRKTNRKGQNVSPTMKAMARMIADPCNAPLVPGFHGTADGIMSRYKSYFAFSQTTEYGYVLWCPEYYGGDFTEGANTSLNSVCFTAPFAGTQIVNEVSDPLGYDAATSGLSVPVGASEFLAGTTAQDFRNISACLRMTYTGTTSDCKGRFALLDNIPAKLLTTDLPSPQTLLGYAAASERISMDVMECTYRPTPQSSKFRDSSASFLLAGDTDVTATSMSEVPSYESPVWIGIVWSGVPSNQLAFEFIQNIEWRPQITKGYVEPPVRQVADSSYAPKVLKFLDTNVPGWSTTLLNGAAKATNAVINRVLGGPAQYNRISRQYASIMQ